MTKDFTKWNKIFLDSTILVDLLSNPSDKKDPEVNDRIEFTKSLIKSLSETPPENGKREFSISAISIAEIFSLNESQEANVYEAMQIILGSNNLVVISFNRDVSLFHNTVFREKLSQRELNTLQQEISYPKNQYVNVQDRIRKDYLIIASALYYNPDVILTGDRKEFMALAKKTGLNCYATDREKFTTSQNGKIIYGVK